jgi:hypothetical protein
MPEPVSNADEFVDLCGHRARRETWAHRWLRNVEEARSDARVAWAVGDRSGAAACSRRAGWRLAAATDSPGYIGPTPTPGARDA